MQLQDVFFEAVETEPADPARVWRICTADRCTENATSPILLHTVF